ncbi:hypothetical protein HHI36_018809 [Cryptolaemus montrouzieri]|uniref:Phospholipid/glycerol acyltransferase domain-containing protein n=1 Tax=Cryptolaemus montrouzieri TaxID=559131 RepID=A0ABD2P1I8_9CUCU
MGYFIGFLYFYLWYTSILAGYICLYCPIFPILLLSNKLYRYLTDIILTFWQQYPTVLLQALCKTEVRVYGDAINSNEISILVMNHRTRTDWNFLWPSLYHSIRGNYRFKYSTKFLLKDSIRFIPGPGWVMQLTLWLFIKRSWKKDKETLEKFCDYIEALNYKFNILVFPEGTDFTEETKKKSDAYAKKNHLEQYNYLLHPRTTGFAYLSSQLIKQNCLDAIYDLTIMYPDVIPQTEKFLFQGKFPRQVKLHIVRYPLAAIPTSEDDLKLFLMNIWNDKEITLKEYYITHNSIPGPCLKKSTLELFPALIFWTVLPFIAMYLMIYYVNFRRSCLFHTIFLVIINFLTPGFQWFEMALYDVKKEIFGHRFAL